jgi:hypothetical protein
MWEFIARLQQKPDQQKRAIAFGFSIVATFFIFAIWAGATFISLGGGNSKVVVTQEDVVAQKKVASAEASPLQSLKQSAAAIGTTFDRVKGLFGNFGKVEYENK